MRADTLLINDLHEKRMMLNPSLHRCHVESPKSVMLRMTHDNRLKRQTLSLEKATNSNIWEIDAIVEVLERKGLCSKQDLYDIIAEIRRKNPRSRIPDAFPDPYVLTESENKIIDDILALLNKHGLTSHQSQNLLERLGSIIEIGQRVAKGTTH